MSATRQSWSNLQPLPAKRSPLFPQRAFTQQEFERIRLGFIPEDMEDKWFLFLEGDTLYVHRSWTGTCIYQLRLVKEGAKVLIRDAFVNREQTQYGGSDDRYDEKLLLFLIDHLLLNKSGPLPGGANVPIGIAAELHHHHILGAGQRAQQGSSPWTVRRMLAWLWQWLLWMVKR